MKDDAGALRSFHIEILSPRQDVTDLDGALLALADKYRRIVDAGYVACFTDNPLGHVAFQGTELIRVLGLPVPPGRVSIHLNAFHTRRNLVSILDEAGALGIGDILVISGDGSERLPKLRGRDVGMDVDSVTSVELVRFIHREYPGRFSVGVAFNPYEPPGHEMEKMRRKVDAGAVSVTTQPLIGPHDSVDALRAMGIAVVVEAWMSKKLHLLSDCVGYRIPEDTPYDPIRNLTDLIDRYPDSGFYLSMLGFNTQFPMLASIGAQRRGGAER